MNGESAGGPDVLARRQPTERPHGSAAERGTPTTTPSQDRPVPDGPARDQDAQKLDTPKLDTLKLDTQDRDTQEPDAREPRDDEPDRPSQDEPAEDESQTGTPTTGERAPERRAFEPLRVVEPPQPRRIRRPVDLVRFISGLVTIGLLILLAELLLGTTTGLSEDILAGGRHAPQTVVNIAGLVANIAVVVVPALLAVSRLIAREGRRVVDGVIAAAIAHAAALGGNALVRHAGNHHFTLALTQAVPGHGTSDSIHTYLVAAVAFITVVDVTPSARWQAMTWTVIALDGITSVLGGYLTPLALVVTIAFGWTLANAARYAFGTSNTRPDGYAVAQALSRVGIDAVRCEQEAPRDDDARRYSVRSRDDDLLDVTVLDRDMQAAGVFYRIWRRARVRGEVRNRSTLSLRRALEHEALLAYAAVAAGTRTPRLVAVAEAGPEAAALVFEHLDGRPLPELEPEELTDPQMAGFWRELTKLHARRIAHRRLTGDVLVVGEDGTLWLSNARAGEVAASELTIRLDVAQLLTTFALIVGPERAVAAAADAIGTDRLAQATPLLQPVALPRATRAALHEHEGLLGSLRKEIIRVRPQAEVEPARLERIRPRTIVMTAAIAVAVYLLLPSLTRMHISEIKDAKIGWVLVALGLSALTYAAATMSIHGFVVERLNLLRLFLVQVGASFVMVVAPAAVGGVAINTRFMQRSGVPPRHAVASAGVSQLVGLVSHISMLVLFAFLAGTEQRSPITPSTTLMVLVLVVTAVVLLVLAVGPVRRYALARVRPFFQGVVPRIVEIIQRPARLALGLAGTVLMSLAYITCLFVCVRAFGQPADFTKVAVVFLAGQAVGSLVPTPGGIGGVEYALTLGLTGVAGLDAAHAASTVLLFRLVTFWLPILPGWVCFAYLQRKHAL